MSQDLFIDQSDLGSMNLLSRHERPALHAQNALRFSVIGPQTFQCRLFIHLFHHHLRLPQDKTMQQTWDRKQGGKRFKRRSGWHGAP
jgi:hypothetical protein